MLFAKWLDLTDSADTDGEGLSDSTELTIGTDPYNPDTDDDGLSDYDEVYLLNYSPVSADTDSDGTPDGQEDPDGDGLTNIQELNFGTNMMNVDTDFDGLSDYDEVMTYRTDPLRPDTDSDGVNDGDEIALGTDPLNAQTEFVTTIASNRVSEGDTQAIDISVTMTSSAESVGSLRVSPASYSDNALLNSQIPGYLNAAYIITADSSDTEMKSATLKFTLGRDVGTIGEDFQPTIYYIDEDTGLFVKVEGQRIEGNTVIAEISHFSSYVMLNGAEFEKVWEEMIDIALPLSGGTTTNTDATIDIVFVIDRSGSMNLNDPEHLALELSKMFTEKLRDGKDKAGVVSFGIDASVIQELTSDKTLLYSAIDSIYYGGGTNGSDGLNSGLNVMDASTAAYKFIIFLTDGEDSRYSYSYDDLIQRAKDSGVIVQTIGMGSASEEILQKIASGTGGTYYHATAIGEGTGELLDLEDVYSKIMAGTADLVTSATTTQTYSMTDY